MYVLSYTCAEPERSTRAITVEGKKGRTLDNTARAGFGISEKIKRMTTKGREQLNRNTYQSMPSYGKLARNLNLPLEVLLEKITPFRKETVYSYVVDTVKHSKGRLYQEGSGPNYQGDMMTLCTCKHRMRTARDADSWNGVWIAGYTSRSRYGEHELFYLMRIAQTFESHHELWFSDSIPEKTKMSKAAHLDKFGDIYQPKTESGDPYSYQDYFAPCNIHVHCSSDLWHKDIKYTNGYGGRLPALLIGDRNFSFLWDEPVLSSPFGIPRGQKKVGLSDLLSEIER